MKTLEVSRLDFAKGFPGLDTVSSALDKLPRNSVGRINWKDFSYKPAVEFSIGYTEREILIKYYVTEKYFKAEKTETNQMVCEDSCVELFISPADDGIYYNLEFNGIGTCLLGSGTSRRNSLRADPGIIGKIRRKTSAGNEPVSEKKGKYSWTITIAVPTGVFFHHNIKSLKSRTFRANFYKCGDMLTEPHYLTWSPVLTPRPDFHRPEYFGMLKFI